MVTVAVQERKNHCNISNNNIYIINIIFAERAKNFVQSEKYCLKFANDYLCHYYMNTLLFANYYLNGYYMNIIV